jgi:uncharacterized protein YdiU (UPF0061 family)
MKELIMLEKTNNQLTNFCERTLNKTGYIDYSKTCFYYVIVWNLEKIADDYKYICELLASENKKVSKECLEYFKETKEYLRAYYELFYSFKLDQLNELNTRKKQLLTKGHKLISTKKGTESTMLTYLTSSVIKITDFSASMIALHTD